jgi:hypothetical protein
MENIAMENIADEILLNPQILQQSGIQKCPACKRPFKFEDGCCCGFSMSTSKPVNGKRSLKWKIG